MLCPGGAAGRFKFGWRRGRELQLVCQNAGEPIPPAAMAQLFKPFTRGAVRASQQGLGLGLYIASEIALYGVPAGLAQLTERKLQTQAA